MPEADVTRTRELNGRKLVDARRVALHPLDGGCAVQQKLARERRADLACEHDRWREPAHDCTERFVARTGFERELGIASADRRRVDVGLTRKNENARLAHQALRSRAGAFETRGGAMPRSRGSSSGTATASHTLPSRLFSPVPRFARARRNGRHSAAVPFAESERLRRKGYFVGVRRSFLRRSRALRTLFSLSK